MLCSSRRQYRDYIIDLYGVHSEQFQLCNAIPILSPFFLYHPYIPHSLIRRIFYFLVSLLFLCMYAYIKSSGFIGGKGPRPLKKLSFCQVKGKSSIWTFTIIIYLIFTESTKVHNTQHLRLVANGYEYATLP